MRREFIRCGVVVLAVVGALGAGQALADIVNGDFETGPYDVSNDVNGVDVYRDRELHRHYELNVQWSFAADAFWNKRPAQHERPRFESGCNRIILDVEWIPGLVSSDADGYRPYTGSVLQSDIRAEPGRVQCPAVALEGERRRHDDRVGDGYIVG